MDPTEIWNNYVQHLTPAELVWKYGQGDPLKAVREYLAKRPCFFGIVRRETWQETFKAVPQYNKESVAAGLLTFLLQTETDWRPEVEETRQAEIRAKAEARARAEAEALALAVARVEAEARARAEAQRLKEQQEGGQNVSPPYEEGASSTPPVPCLDSGQSERHPAVLRTEMLTGGHYENMLN